MSQAADIRSIADDEHHTRGVTSPRSGMPSWWPCSAPIGGRSRSSTGSTSGPSPPSSAAPGVRRACRRRHRVQHVPGRHQRGGLVRPGAQSGHGSLLAAGHRPARGGALPRQGRSPTGAVDARGLDSAVVRGRDHPHRRADRSATAGPGRPKCARPALAPPSRGVPARRGGRDPPGRGRSHPGHLTHGAARPARPGPASAAPAPRWAEALDGREASDPGRGSAASPDSTPVPAPDGDAGTWADSPDPEPPSAHDRSLFPSNLPGGSHGV